MQYPNIAQPQYGFAPTMPMMANGGSVANAQSVQSKGRGRDTMLVHMTPKEVGGLQALAMQQGGSLTINPQTGLPEAGFLENILPTLLGAALTIGTGGVINPLTAGMIVGGGTAVATGDLSKGLMAGLGAYGGAGLGAGLTSAGASTAVPGAVAPTAGAGGIEFANAGSPEFLASQGAGAAPTAITPPTAPIAPTIGDTGAAIYGGAPSQAMELANLGVDPMAVAGDSSRVLTGTGQTAPTAMDNFAQAGRGVKNIFTEPGGFDKFIGTAADPKTGAKATGLGGGYGAAKTVGMAAAPALLAQPEFEMPEEEESNYEGPYTPSARRVSYPGEEERRRTSEFTYFNPSNPVPFAEGGETAGLGALGDSISPSEAQVYQNIANVQRLAGIPAIDPSRFSVAPSRGYERFVYNPIEGGPVPPEARREVNYEFAPLMSKEEAEAEVLKRQPTSPFSRLFDESSGYATGGSVPQLEDGGFVLTKKAVDGLGRGSNKKGQANAQRGLGAIPIRGRGTGTSDSIKTSIEGKRPALVSNGEAYVPKKQVAKKGGAKAFYALMKQAEKAADKRRRA
jgi:hypothetical protein